MFSNNVTDGAGFLEKRVVTINAVRQGQATRPAQHQPVAFLGARVLDDFGGLGFAWMRRSAGWEYVGVGGLCNFQVLTVLDRNEAVYFALVRADQDASVGDTIKNDATREAATLLDRSWPEMSGEIARGEGARLDRELSIVSVGEATRTGVRSVRVPLVLGDAEGGTSTLVLSIQLDALVEGDPD